MDQHENDKYLQDPSCLAEMMALLAKDFDNSGINDWIPFIPDSYATAVKDLSAFLKELPADRLASLLYRVDVPEELFNSIPPGDTNAIAALILKRELLKVLTRRIYKPQ